MSPDVALSYAREALEASYQAGRCDAYAFQCEQQWIATDGAIAAGWKKSAEGWRDMAKRHRLNASRTMLRAMGFDGGEELLTPMPVPCANDDGPQCGAEAAE